MTEIERMSSSLKKELCRWKPEDEFSHGKLSVYPDTQVVKNLPEIFKAD